ncbi:MAG: hypothetical protein AVDCRST_MAG01-01-310, partial [uncultured Rubrobacteraceae bacterium]
CNRGRLLRPRAAFYSVQGTWSKGSSSSASRARTRVRKTSTVSTCPRASSTPTP